MPAFYEQRPEKLFIGEMTRFPYPAHIHDTAELVVPTRGSVVLGIDEARWRLFPGDAAMIFPLVPHSYEELSEDAEGLVAIFPPDIIPEYAGTFHGLLPEKPVLSAQEAGEEVRLAAARLQRFNMKDDMPMCIAYLHVLLAGVLHRLTFRPVYYTGEGDIGDRIIRYISDHAFEDISLESAARGLGISASHLSHFFSGRMHTSFRHFINTIRITRARLMMRDPKLTLTWICDACGYTSMRTFRRAFQREFGCLPSEHILALRSMVPVNRENQEE